MGQLDGSAGDISLASIHQQMKQMGIGHRITQSPPVEQVEVSLVQPEEWLEWIGLTQYSGRFSNAVVEGGLLYLKSYTGFWFRVCGVRITNEVLMDHTPWLQQISQ